MQANGEPDGFKEIKLKGGVLDSESEIESIRALRDEFGAGVPLRIDPNCAWSVDTSVHVGESLKKSSQEEDISALCALMETYRDVVSAPNHAHARSTQL